MTDALRFKLADQPSEFEGIHRLNYRSFVEEIPQHPPNEAKRLVDRFHAENTYAVCLSGDKVVGMIAGRRARPFSLESKLPDLQSHLPPHRRLVEVRLLAVDPAFRKQTVFARLAGELANHFRVGQGCDLAIISGTVRELRLYRHLGFQPFGPLVGNDNARYQPMVLTLDDYAARVAHLEVASGRSPTNLMPGPVAVSDGVAEAFAGPAISHRSAGFGPLMDRVRLRLREMCGSEGVALMCGTGTLANDVVAAQLAAQSAAESAAGGRPGLVLSNGEFGERLIDHAGRWRLRFQVLRAGWGRHFDAASLRNAFDGARPGWVWMVACETSTGMRNALDLPRALCEEAGADLCVDAISALGLQPIDLRGCRFVSTVSGKALGAFPGLAIVAHDGRLAPAGSVPRYLDLAAHRDADGVPFTQSSNLLAALDAALSRDQQARWQRVREADQALRHGLRRHGLAIVVDDSHAMPGLISLALPPEVHSARLARRMARCGYQLAHRSKYLEQRNWVQICLMGEWETHALDILPEVLATQTRACAAQAAVQEQADR